MQMSMQRIHAAAEAQAKNDGIEFTHFTFHDIKRRACTDYVGNKMAVTEYRSSSMMKIYDVSVPLIKPIRE
jgi:hypothetical protein